MTKFLRWSAWTLSDSALMTMRLPMAKAKMLLNILKIDLKMNWVSRKFLSISNPRKILLGVTFQQSANSQYESDLEGWILTSFWQILLNPFFKLPKMVEGSYKKKLGFFLRSKAQICNHFLVGGKICFHNHVFRSFRSWPRWHAGSWSGSVVSWRRKLSFGRILG